MTLGVLPTKLGMVGATPIIADVSSGSLTGGELVKVILLANYARDPAPGFLLGGTPAGSAPGEPTTWPHTIPAGTQLRVVAAEAAALIAAGAATVL